MTKTCALCGVKKETVEFGKDRHRTDGLCSYCKPCIHIKKNNPKKFAELKKDKKRRVDLEKKNRRNKQFKYCPCCNETKQVSEFNKNKSKGDGLSSHCTLCYRMINSNRDKGRAQYDIEYKNRKKAIRRKGYEKNSDTEKARARRRIDSLCRSYVAALLRRAKILVAQDTIELYKDIIKIKREIKK